MPAQPPSPPGTWLGGHLGQLKRDRLGFFRNSARDYGDVVGLRFGPRRALLVSHPDAIESVLLTQAKNFTKHWALRLTPSVLGQGLLTSEGDFWLRQRRLIQPSFGKSRVNAYAPVMVDAVNRMLARWRPGMEVSIQAEMMRFTLEIAARTLFGADVEGDAATVSQALQVMQDTFLVRFNSLILLPLWLPLPSHLRLRSAVKKVDAILFRFIKERRAKPGEVRDLLSALLAARDEDGTGRMTDQQVRDEAMTIFLAGHETTALAMTWTWVLLAQHPEVQEKLFAEVDGVLAGGPPTPEDMPKLPYTDAILTESMRLYPPAYVVGREAIAECAVGGYTVPRGMTLMMPQWVVQRDPRWFPQPDEFRPERWLDGSTDALPKYAYFPFGGGPRICIGNTFAMLEMVLALARIAQSYRFTPPAVEVKPTATFTLRPSNGVAVTLAGRG